MVKVAVRCLAMAAGVLGRGKHRGVLVRIFSCEFGRNAVNIYRDDLKIVYFENTIGFLTAKVDHFG